MPAAADDAVDVCALADAVTAAHASLARQVAPFMEFDLLTQLTTGHCYTRKCCADIVHTLRTSMRKLVALMRTMAVGEADAPRVAVRVGPTPASLRDQGEELAFIVGTYTAGGGALAASQIEQLERMCGVLIDASERQVMAALSIPRIMRDALGPARGL